MKSPMIQLFATKSDLRDLAGDLIEYAKQYGVTVESMDDQIVFEPSASTGKKAVFVLSQYADNVIDNKIHLTKNQKAYIELIKHTNVLNDLEKPEIYVYIRSELLFEYKKWKVKLQKAKLLVWLNHKLENVYKQDKFHQLLHQLEKTREQILDKGSIEPSNYELKLLKTIHELGDSDFLQLFRGKHKTDGYRQTQALLLFLFIFIHETNKEREEYKKDWRSTFNNLVDLKASLRYALFPPLIKVDFRKARDSGGLPILAVSLQRFERISENSYEICLEIINAGKTPLMTGDNKSIPFLRIVIPRKYFIKNELAFKNALYALQMKPSRRRLSSFRLPQRGWGGGLPITSEKNDKDKEEAKSPSVKYAPNLPPVWAAGERRVVRFIYEKELSKMKLKLIFRFRSNQLFTIENSFILQLGDNLRESELVFADYHEICDAQTIEQRKVKNHGH